MQAIMLFAVMVLPFCFSAAAQTTDQNVGASKEVFETIAKWADAVRDRDTKALDKIFEADVVITTVDGKTRGKTEELEILKPGGAMKTVSISNDDIKLRIFDKTAVVTARTRMNFIVGGTESSAAFRYTAVFLKKDGRWQIVALQTARAPQTPVTKVN